LTEANLGRRCRGLWGQKLIDSLEGILWDRCTSRSRSTDRH
jgi:hypothetical protein